MRLICKIMWNLSELFGINLGKSAPYVFGGMIGNKPIKIKRCEKTYTKTCTNGHRCVFDDDMKEKYCMCGLEYECSMDTHCCCDDCQKENVKMD